MGIKHTLEEGMLMAEFHQISVHEAVAKLRSDHSHGLSDAEARARLQQYGPNQLRQQKPISAWRRLLAQLQDTLVVLLLVAAAISAVVWYIEGDKTVPYESVVILSIVLLNALLGFVQEDRAEKALAALREMSAPEATVVRDGEARRIPARAVVPGDLLLIEEGYTIPADARLIETIELKTLEASLTGESVPVRKDSEPIASAAALGDRRNIVFSGTAVAYGHGRAVVFGTGMNTELGRIAGLLETAKTEPTPLQRELDCTGKRLGVAVIVIALLVVATLLVAEGDFDARTALDALLFGVALAVAAVPEGLAAIVTLVLAIGVQRMARRGAIVRKLPAVEALGSATVIASDKTGTLTRNEMTVRVVVTRAGRVDVGGTGYIPEGEFHSNGTTVAETHRTELRCLLEGSALDNNASLTNRDGSWSIVGDPTEGALIVAARKAGFDKQHLEQRFPRVREIPFSAERKMMSTIHEDRGQGGGYLLWAKGAPDVLLDRCTFELDKDRKQSLTDDRRAELRRINGTLTREALRTLAVAYRNIPAELDEQHCDGDKLERELIFAGFLGMIDPPRPEVFEAVKRAKQAGIRPIVITGDHPGTALAIASELGIGSDGRVVTGPELEQMSGSQLSSTVAEVSVYARVNPSHKIHIVDALQARKSIVAMTGDGVNDAPALKAADIGVAMGLTGTDVSKEAADIILTDDNFATIVAAVEEGRAVFTNIRKFLRYLLSSNFGEVLTIFGGVVFAGLLGLRDRDGLILPLLATQVLWINLITDGAPALALGVDPPERHLMELPPRPPEEHVITPEMWITVGLVGVVMSIATLLVLDASLPGGLIEGTAGIRHGRTMAFTTLVLCQLFNAFNSRSNQESAFVGSRRNHYLIGAVLLSLALHLIAIHHIFFQQAFQTTSLSIRDWVTCLLVSSSVLWVIEAYKFVIRHRQPAIDVSTQK